MRLSIVLAIFIAGFLILLTACGSEEVERIPLPESFLSCQEAKLGEIKYCDEEKGIAISYIQEVDQYFVIPLKVTSVDDWRKKKDRGFKLSFWKDQGIDDLCQVKVKAWIEPNELVEEIMPEETNPPGCRSTPAP
ncbi:MAG: hypothetical protein Q8P22_14290 [Chloroflexota bacterium]|nr:hypothetical protein [Chloroflexota bacterium]